MRSGSILLVDDEDTLRALIRTILEGTGNAVAEASNGAKALEICRSREKKFQLLITDISMPGMHGTELAHVTRRLYPRMPIACMTGDRVSDVPSGTDVLLHKPFTGEALLAVVRKLIESHQPKAAK